MHCMRTHSAKNVALRMVSLDFSAFLEANSVSPRQLFFSIWSAWIMAQSGHVFLFFFLALLCLVFSVISLQLINHSNLLSRKDFGVVSLSEEVVEGNHIAE